MPIGIKKSVHAGPTTHTSLQQLGTLLNNNKKNWIHKIRIN